MDYHIINLTNNNLVYEYRSENSIDLVTDLNLPDEFFDEVLNTKISELSTVPVPFKIKTYFFIKRENKVRALVNFEVLTAILRVK